MSARRIATEAYVSALQAGLDHDAADHVARMAYQHATRKAER